MPLPIAVEPSFSRCIRISKIARSFWPLSAAARAASSCSTCFLLLTLSAGMIAFGATRSMSGMNGTWGAKPLPGADFYSSMTRGKNLRSLSAIVLKGGGP